MDVEEVDPRGRVEAKPYTLRQTRPDQVTTHWDTCYTLHSACMERKVETMTQAIQAAEKLGAYTAMKFAQQLEVNAALRELVLDAEWIIDEQVIGTKKFAAGRIPEEWLVDARALLAQPVTPGEAP